MTKLNKFVTGFLVAAMVMLLAGCETGRGRDCIGFVPTYLDRGDILTPATQRTILQNNEYGQLHCGWRPIR